MSVRIGQRQQPRFDQEQYCSIIVPERDRGEALGAERHLRRSASLGSASARCVSDRSSWVMRDPAGRATVERSAGRSRRATLQEVTVNGPRQDEVDRAAPPTPRGPARKVAHLSPAERVARGKAARNATPRSSHGRWEPATNRPDPVALLEEQGASRVPELVPIRYGRMLVSPFTFYRGRGADHGRRPRGHPTLGPATPRSAVTPTCRTSACSPRRSGR